jgi:hypothetical protein
MMAHLAVAYSTGPAQRKVGLGMFAWMTAGFRTMGSPYISCLYALFVRI